MATTQVTQSTAQRPWLAAATIMTAAGAILGALLTSSAADGWQLLHWLCKPLTTALIFLLAWRTVLPISVRYRRFILAGIGFSLLGDIFLMLPQDLFIAGLLSFLLAHACFIAAFAGGLPFTTGPWQGVLCLAYGALALWILWPSLATPLRGPVIVYMAVLLTMLVQALARAVRLRERGDPLAAPARLAVIGAVLFVISDSLLAWDRFRAALPLASLWVLSSYWAALWLIARSVSRQSQLKPI
ncbi:lysoplasmalogenase [Dyella tabacisoli]|uniref:Lysoplasmalogenase n=1 Tax=Dyella tabacisoli TaxID=2282381 RepID=A0A369UJG1_9GAMM|nr:lysoplasmalogenase [Dyella tabacisoli]RDD80666.1 lysoplasmalogenase [Dyella tabacisoli]